MSMPADDSFHDRTEDPLWNESAWFGFMIPEHKIDGFVYFWHRPNMKLTSGGMAVWNDKGEELHNCLYYAWNQYNPLSNEADMFRFSTEIGLTVEVKEPLQSYHLNFDGEGATLDLIWEGVIPVQDKVWADWATWGKRHYEQTGRVTGTLRLGGETYEVNAFHCRDHSWGPRRAVTPYTRGGYQWAAISEENLFASICHISNSDTDPFGGTVEQLASGYYVEDGIVAAAVSGTRRVTKRGEDGRPLEIVADGVDELGRTWQAEGRAENLLKWHDYGLFEHWQLMRWSLNGVECWGESQDFFRLQQVRKLQRNLMQG